MEKLLIGEIVKPQGIKGEVKIKFYSLQNLHIEIGQLCCIGNQEMKINEFAIREGFLYAKFDLINSRNEAELCRNQKVYIEKSLVSECLKDGEYFADEIIGFQIFVNEKLVGTLVDIQNFGSADVFYCKKSRGEEILFPAVSGLILNVDKENQKIILDKIIFSQVAVL